MNFNNKKIQQLLFVTTFVTLFCYPASLFAQADETELAKQTQNPVGDLISVPFQNNIGFNYGPEDKVQNVLNIQPVVPFSLGENWNLITRTIMPVVYMPSLTPSGNSKSGLGDINLTAFISPSNPTGLIWGAGPIFSIPSAIDNILGSGKWGIGPSAVVLAMKNQWVYGAIVNNVWSIAGDSERGNMNQMLFQPFLNYNFSNGAYFSSGPIITANWKAESGNQWTVPLGGGVGKIVKLGPLPLNLSAQAFYNVVTPDYGANWTLRLQVQMLFPK